MLASNNTKLKLGDDSHKMLSDKRKNESEKTQLKRCKNNMKRVREMNKFKFDSTVTQIYCREFVQLIRMHVENECKSYKNNLEIA